MSHDDILNVKIQRKILNKNWNRPREYFEKRRMNNILKIIPDEGMHHDQLAHWLGIDRKTLRPHMGCLQKMGLVTREPGRHGKYFLTKKTHRGTIISADIFAESFKDRFLDSLNEKFVLDSPYFKRKIPSVEFELEDALFNFSNLIGGWVTYILIQSMDPTNKLIDSEDIFEQNLAVEIFIEDTISLIQPRLLSFFNFYINALLETLHKRIKSLDGGLSNKNILKVIFEDFLFNRRTIVLDDEIASELNNAFSNVYPNFSQELDKTKRELPTLVKHEIDEMKRHSERARRRELCKPHEYIQLADDYDDGYHVFQCKKCEKRKWEEK